MEYDIDITKRLP